MKSGIEFERFATGHYAQLVENNGIPRLYRGADEKKDQSYFLYRLNRSQLSKLCFPLGKLRKSEVKTLAKAFELGFENKPESQDFYSGDHIELLKTADRIGNIVDTTGRVLGTHRGVWHYTIGQRKGLGISADRPLYVIALNVCRNEVVLGESAAARSYELRVRSWHWISEAGKEETQLRIRSTGDLQKCSIEGTRIFVPAGVWAAAPGQSAVIYRGAEVLGGGILM